MRKNILFAATLTGMLIVGLMGCGNHLQAIGKESIVPVQAVGKAMGSMDAVREKLTTAGETIAAGEPMLSGIPPKPSGIPENQQRLEAGEETAEGWPGKEGTPAPPQIQGIPEKTEEPRGPERPQAEKPPIQEEGQAEAQTPAGHPIQKPAQAEMPPPAGPAGSEEAAPEPEGPEEATPGPVEAGPREPKSIYDYEFDIEAIRQELIALGEGMGLTHITTDDGMAVTPGNASWATPVTASESFQGASLERKLKDYVQSMPGIITAYGGNPITLFTIYAEPLGGGSYRIYFLY